MPENLFCSSDVLKELFGFFFGFVCPESDEKISLATVNLKL